MVADTLGYSDRSGTPEPAVEPFRKVFSWGGRILIGSAGMLWQRPHKHTVGFDVDGHVKTIPFEYKFEDWISAFCAERTDSSATPAEFAHEVFIKARQTFQPVEVVAKVGGWRGDNPDDPIVIYTIAGFSEDFEESGIYETRIDLNAEGNGLEYVPPLYHPDKIWLTGQIQYIMQALRKKEPYISLLRSSRDRCVAQIEALFPNIESDIKELTAFAVGSARVQSDFTPNTVGSLVTIMIADRESRRVLMGTL